MQGCVCMFPSSKKKNNDSLKERNFLSVPLGFSTDPFCIFSATGLNCHCLALKKQLVYFLLHESL